jgi:AcrR family transcriptional regulator
MTSLRHNNEPRDGYLDAARDCILDVGWRRTTLTEVARRAGVSRMTIYRTWSDMPTLLGDLMTREWAGVVAASLAEEHADERAEAPDGDSADDDPGTPTIERLVADIVGTVQRLRDNELFVRIVDLDPELILPYLFSRRGRSQDGILELTVNALREAQAAGVARQGNPVAMARAMLLAAHGFVLSVHTMIDEDATAEELDAELRLALTRSLEP